MLQRRDKKSNWLTVRAPLIITIGLVVSGLFVVSLLREISDRDKIQREIERLADDISRMDNANNELERFVSSWEDSSQLEREARIKLGLKKSGEQVVVIDRDNQQTSQSNIITSDRRVIGSVIDQETQTSNINKWWKYFFN